eukprot:COSAG01_NODE_23185_length_825_cov_0.957300_1_plen_29_part_10
MAGMWPAAAAAAASFDCWLLLMTDELPPS